MTAGVLIALLIAGAALAWVVAPLLRSDASEAERVAATVSAEMDLHSRHEMVLAALKDLEEDRATDKLDDADYRGLKDRLSAQAVELMKQIDVLDEEHRRREARGPRKTIPHPSAPS